MTADLRCPEHIGEPALYGCGECAALVPLDLSRPWVEPPFLRDALVAKLAKAVGRSVADAEKVAGPLLLQSFLDERGNLDDDRVASFAALWGAPAPVAWSPPAQPSDPVRDALERARVVKPVSTDSPSTEPKESEPMIYSIDVEEGAF